MPFDASAFLDLPVDTPMVKRPPLPATDYIATVKQVDARQWTSKDKVDEATGRLKSGIAYDVTLTLEVPEATRLALGLTNPTLELKDGIMLEMTPDGKGIDFAPGKNNQLRRYREALDMNKPGDVFRARDMAGKMLLVKIKHEEYPAGSGDFFERVASPARLPS